MQQRAAALDVMVSVHTVQGTKKSRMALMMSSGRRTILARVSSE